MNNGFSLEERIRRDRDRSSTFIDKIFESGRISEKRVESDIKEIGNPFDRLSYLGKVFTLMGLQQERPGVIQLDDDRDFILAQLYSYQKDAISEVHTIADMDNMTGLYNKRVIEEKTKGRDPKDKYAVLMVDIDHFSRINTKYGHSVGDLVIKNAARIILESVRESFVGRYGGEEFYVELNQTDKEGGKIAAERVRKNIEEKLIDYVVSDMERQERNVPEGFRQEKITLSIGVADEKQGQQPYEVRDRADKALYQAKKFGRNLVVLDGEDPSKNFGVLKRNLFSALDLTERGGEALSRFADYSRRLIR
jgi:diguanylate cyclase (GGDEF)-like protein